MKYRSLLMSFALTSLLGCYSESWDDYHSRDSEIVFGISQSKATDGKVTTSVGYEYLDVIDHGWNARGVVTRDRSCWAERLDDRLGQPHVEGGVAKFEGALLPPGGVAVVANRPDDLKIDGPAWNTAGESVTFEAQGFAMPTIRPSKLVLPSTDLAIVTPADPAAEISVAAATELEVAWTPGEAGKVNESVVASLVAAPEGQPDARGVEIRCFFDRKAGKGLFPQKLMDRFISLMGQGAIKGKLRVATHRQLTIFADGGWTVYVVATVDQREQPFVLQR